MDAIEVTDLSKTYISGLFRKRRIEALRTVSLSVAPGEIFGLLGPNGAGKTTLVKILLSIVRPSSGHGSILDIPVSFAEARRSCGYLPENHRYPGFLTATDTLRFFGGMHGVPRETLRIRSVALLERVGLSQWTSMRIKRYSKGMLQRLGLAQALVSDPSVLFLDEPTDGVDPIGRKEIRDILLSLKAEGKTIFLNSHLLSEVETICDRVAVLREGRILRAGSIAELTQARLEYEIGTSPTAGPTVMERILVNTVSAELRGSVLHVTLREPRQLNEVMDILRSEHIDIVSINQVKTSLEESFIQLIKSAKD